MRKNLQLILKGGADKLTEAGAVLTGGHTIKDDTAKYGLTVTGIVHPGKIVTNSAARAGEKLILTKSLGTGIALAGRRIGELTDNTYAETLNSMTQLNDIIDIFEKYNIRCATDITGFGFAGHGLEIAEAGNVSLKIYTEKLPILPEVYGLIDLGCLPCALFKNLECFENKISCDENLDYNLKMLCFDAQTSGGIMFTCESDNEGKIIAELRSRGFAAASVVGEVIQGQGDDKRIILDR